MRSHLLSWSISSRFQTIKQGRAILSTIARCRAHGAPQDVSGGCVIHTLPDEERHVGPTISAPLCHTAVAQMVNDGKYVVLPTTFLPQRISKNINHTSNSQQHPSPVSFSPVPSISSKRQSSPAQRLRCLPYLHLTFATSSL